MPSKELYQLAVEFRKTKLWERLYDSELFAVGMPNGEVGYISVMGMLGEHLALAVYVGEQGLCSYRLLSGINEHMRDAERIERMMSQDCVMCSFEPKAELRPRDLQEIKEYGLTFHGKNAYPLLERFRPCCSPWYLEGAQDEEYLHLGLLAGLEAARRLNGADIQQDFFHTPDPGAAKESLGFQEGAPYGRDIPLLTPQADGTFLWSRIALPASVEPTYPSPILTDDLALRKLSKQPKSGIWECGVMMHQEPIALGKTDADGNATEPESAPYFPLVLLIVDHENGMVLHLGFEEPGAGLDGLLDGFAEGISKTSLPSQVLVRDDRTHALLRSVSEQLGIRLTIVAQLPLLDEAEDSLCHREPINELDQMEAMLDNLMRTADPKAMPKEFRQQMEQLLASNVLSAATADKLRTFLAGSLSADSPQAKKTPTKGKKRHPLKSFILSVSLGKGCYRHIRIGAGEALYSLSRAILNAFEFEDDHAHAFFMDNHMWSPADAYHAPYLEEGRSTGAYRLADLDLEPGMLFKYVFDFGDEWVFQCKVLQILPQDTLTAVVVRSAGQPPSQYDRHI